MLNYFTRNEEALKSFDYIYYNSFITVTELIYDYNIPITTENCKICEGNGWTSKGIKFIYKDIYCEV